VPRSPETTASRTKPCRSSLTSRAECASSESSESSGQPGDWNALSLGSMAYVARTEDWALNPVSLKPGPAHPA
jgi:hypothetical protein